MCKEDCKCQTKCSSCACETEEELGEVTVQDSTKTMRETFEEIKKIHDKVVPKDVELLPEEQLELDDFKLVVKETVESHIKTKMKLSKVNVMFGEKNEITMDIHGTDCNPKIKFNRAVPGSIEFIKKCCLDSAKKNEHRIKMNMLFDF